MKGSRVRLASSANEEPIVCPGCRDELRWPVPRKLGLVVVFQCPKCASVSQIERRYSGKAKVSLVHSPSVPLGATGSTGDRPSFPIIWTPGGVQRVALLSDVVDTERVPRKDDPGGYPYMGYVSTDQLVIALYPGSVEDPLGGWGLAACRCAGCRKLLERFAWPRPRMAGNPPLTGVLVLDQQLKSREALRAGVERVASAAGCAAAVLHCRACRVSSMYLLRGKGLRGAALNLDKVGPGMEQLF
jgi:hypothetical protein